MEASLIEEVMGSIEATLSEEDTLMGGGGDVAISIYNATISEIWLLHHNLE